MVRMSIAAGIAVATAAFLAAPVAEAARCPSGQIWRVSKKTCMNKAAAIKAGIFKARKGKKAAKTVHTRRAPPPPARPVVEKAESERPSIAAPLQFRHNEIDKVVQGHRIDRRHEVETVAGLSLEPAFHFVH
ncbi:MAG: hypothetical protein AB7J19_15975, partial [Beijerinckiaceae bacterium]